MITKKSNSNLQNKIIRVGLVTVFVLLIPLIAMQFTNEVDWDLFDFIVMGALLFGTGITYELVAGKIKNSKHRAIFALVLLATFLLIWAELAVGVFGSPFAGS